MAILFFVVGVNFIYHARKVHRVLVTSAKLGSYLRVSHFARSTQRAAVCMVAFVLLLLISELVRLQLKGAARPPHARRARPPRTAAAHGRPRRVPSDFRTICAPRPAPA